MLEILGSRIRWAAFPRELDGSLPAECLVGPGSLPKFRRITIFVEREERIGAQWFTIWAIGFPSEGGAAIVLACPRCTSRSDWIHTVQDFVRSYRVHTEGPVFVVALEDQLALWLHLANVTGVRTLNYYLANYLS